MPQTQVTVSGERRRLRTPPGLLAEARHVVLPEGICASGLPAAQATLAEIGLFFDPWQVDAASVILGKNSLGLYAADTVLLSIPRQVGKTFLVGLIVFADCIINPGTLTVWTAHRFKVSRETFDELRGLAMLPAMAPHIDPDAITTAAGNETIPFRNGSRIVFAARERGSVRGFRKVRRLILDEAQILTEAAMSDLAPTQNQAANPQLIMMGTPPKPTDPGETFTSLREDALEDRADGLVYIEFSAEPGADPDDREAWRVANPSIPHRTPERAIVRLRKLLANDDDFLREALGIWLDPRSRAAAIDPNLWLRQADPSAEQGPAPRFAVATAPDRSWAAICAAWTRPDGSSQVSTVDYRPTATWVATRLEELGAHPENVLVDTASRGLVPGAQEPSQQAQAQAHNAFSDALLVGSVFHDDQGELNTAVRAAHWRPLGDSRVLDRKGSADISPLIGVALALHALTSEPDYDVLDSIG